MSARNRPANGPWISCAISMTLIPSSGLLIVTSPKRSFRHSDSPDYHAYAREISSLDSAPIRPVRSSPMEPSIYKYPDIFRRAHLESPGEIPAEVAFLQQAWRRHRKSPVRRVLDIPCGDSRHVRLLADHAFNVLRMYLSHTMIASVLA